MILDTQDNPEREPLVLPRNEIGHQAILLNIVMALAYFFVIAFLFPVDSRILFAILILGELFHLWQIFTYLHTLWRKERPHAFNPEFQPGVDVFITVAGEPEEVIEETVRAATGMQYPNFTVHILNDGLVAGKANWREPRQVAKKYGVDCITRTMPGGAKAGNINHALAETHEPFAAVFDVDHAPHYDFLTKMMGYFIDPKVGFTQSPQYYRNHWMSGITGGAWEQQELFFGAICRGKDTMNAAFMCGTNMVIRRSALLEAGGMHETSITEDFLTSLFIHARGWKSVYVPEVLAEGLAPEDFRSYYSQQSRWARGSLEMVFRYNPLFKKGLTFSQRIQYLASSSYYLSGAVVFVNALFPLIFFYTGLEPFRASTMALATIFLPYIFLVIYTLQKSTNFSYTFRALGLSMSAFPIQMKAFVQILSGKKAKFVVTSKRKLSGNFAHLAAPHILYVAAAMIGMSYAVWHQGFTASVVDNIAWALFNIAAFTPFIMAALPAARPSRAIEPATAIQPAEKQAIS
ncbi:MAG TPA: glycosyltransferase [Candidatus Paceibacterota bacterium]|nr:glycosyltransferase [Candidatus Paceibacterota bacterium]